MTALHLFRDELAARLERTKRRRVFGATVAELERTVDALERALVAFAFGDGSTVDVELAAVRPWLRSEAWHAAKAETGCVIEIARAA